MNLSSVLGDVSNLMSIGQSVFSLLAFLKTINSDNTYSALFKWDGTLLEGSDKIKLKIYVEQADTKWWYYVEPIEDYYFVRLPVIQSCVNEVAGQNLNTDKVQNAIYWRYVGTSPQGVIRDGNVPNIKVDFIIVAYKPKDILDFLASKK